jgi:hypothetical protein
MDAVLAQLIEERAAVAALIESTRETLDQAERLTSEI